MQDSKFVFEHLRSVLPHECDGLIFTPVLEGYIHGSSLILFCIFLKGTYNKLLKWKPPHLNTVDFLLSHKVDEANGVDIVRLLVGKLLCVLRLFLLTLWLLCAFKKSLKFFESYCGF